MNFSPLYSYRTRRGNVISFGDGLGTGQTGKSTAKVWLVYCHQCNKEYVIDGTIDEPPTECPKLSCRQPLTDPDEEEYIRTWN